MIINSRNGNKTNENEYIDLYSDIITGFIVNGEKIPMHNIPRVNVSGLHYLQYGDMLYIKKQTEDDMEFVYIIKQALVNGNLKVVDIWTTTKIPEYHPLEKLIQWSHDYNNYNIQNNLKVFLKPLSYCINVDSLVEQVLDRICKIDTPMPASTKELSKKGWKTVEVEYNGVVYNSFKEFCDTYGINYKTSWTKYHNGKSLSQLVAGKTSKPVMKKKEKTLTGSINAMSKKYNISYGTLWTRIKIQGMTMEEALKGVELRNEEQVDKE